MQKGQGKAGRNIAVVTGLKSWDVAFRKNAKRAVQKLQIRKSRENRACIGIREGNDFRRAMAGTKDGCLAEDAASHIGGRCDPIQGVHGDTAEINSQAALLVERAFRNKAVLDKSCFAGLLHLGNATAGHDVFCPPGENRAVKRTHAGCFGVTPQAKGAQRDATPLFYLRRVQLMNQVFDARIRLEGVAFHKSLLLGKTEGEHPCLVSSQP